MADRPDAAPAARWIAPGDLGAFFALALDNLTNLVLLASILVGGFGFPADVFATRMVPGTALGVMVGDLAYTWMAMRLRHATGRTDITAMPLGLDTPSTVGMAVAVLGPTWLATHDALLTWHVGMAVMVLMAVVKSFDSFPVDGHFLQAVGRMRLHELGASLFASSLWIALPMIAMLLFVNLTLGIISRVAPQMNIYAVGFPVTLTVGMLGITATLPMLEQPMLTLLQQSMDLFGGGR